jgi:putative transposase
VGVLRRKVRNDAGRQDSVGAALKSVLQAQYAAHKGWSAQLHYNNVVALAEARPEVAPVPSYSTVRRFLAVNGLFKLRRLTSKRTEGAERAEARLEDREVRSYKSEYVNGLWHRDCHHGSRKVVRHALPSDAHPLRRARRPLSGRLPPPVVPARERREHRARAFAGHPEARPARSAMSDNGTAMKAEEITEGLTRLGVTRDTTLPYSPYQNGKQENFWTQVERQLLTMLEDVPDPTLATLNETTQRGWSRSTIAKFTPRSARHPSPGSWPGGGDQAEPGQRGATARLHPGGQPDAAAQRRHHRHRGAASRCRASTGG